MSLTALRERSIDGYKNNSTVFKAIRTIKNNVIGTGIQPTPVAVVGDNELTKTEIKTIKKHWDWFVKNCDFDGFFNFYGLQGLGMQTVAMQGEIFVVRQRDASGVVPFKLQIMTPNMCDHNRTGYLLSERPDHYVVQGVEFDARGRKVGYWMHEYNPNNEYVIKLAPKFVPIDDVLQVFYKEFPEQVRGIPFGTSAMLNMRDLSDYEDAQLMLQKIAACHVAFTTKPAPTEDLTGEGDADSSADHMEPGLIEHLLPGEEVTFNRPPTATGYAEYVSKNQQKNAAGFGITYEQITGDMSNVNFSSGRMGWIEAQRQVEDWQYNFFIPQFCDKVWAWFIMGLQVRGLIKRDVAAEWTPQGREMIDPVKEMNGLILELKSGLISWTEACKRRGYNPDVLFAQIKKDKDMFKAAGIEVEWILTKVEEIESDPDAPIDGERSLSAEDLKRVLDAYGVGVRAGTITPTAADEAYFRTLAQFPEMGDAVVQAWADEGGFRRPITLTPPEGEEPAAVGFGA
jgi:lambda family phage portal protein